MWEDYLWAELFFNQFHSSIFIKYGNWEEIYCWKCFIFTTYKNKIEFRIAARPEQSKSITNLI